MILDKILENRVFLIELFGRFGATKVRVFGSVARRQENENSDIDFLAQFSDNLDDMMSLKKELESFFERDVDLATYDAHSIKRILEESILL